MTTRKLARGFLWLIATFMAVLTGWVLLTALQIRWAWQDYEGSTAAGLAASPPPEVGFDVVSPWGARSVVRGLATLISPSPTVVQSYGQFSLPDVPAYRIGQRLDRESYDFISDNPFISVDVDPRTTFSVDVDTASYANVRRFLTQGNLPPKDAVRIEELINYFAYDYPAPAGADPISLFADVAPAPWQPRHRLARIGIRAKDIDMENRSSSNLVFLIDVSGSMDDPAKLPLLKSAMKLLVENLTENDRVALVVYAGAEGLVLPSTTGDHKSVLLNAIDNLTPAGFTNGGAGIKLAYTVAVSNFIKGGINRVILATDGDFNVGVTNEGDLVRLIQEKAKSGVFLSVLGFGSENLQDSLLEKLADKGNGQYAYIDTINEARKVLVSEFGGTLITVAKDVKVQIEFNPAQVSGYRLIGYENRTLSHQEFNDDTKDAGDMGAGHTVTALVELVPKGIPFNFAEVDPLKYQNTQIDVHGELENELLNIKIRYKEPDGDTSRLIQASLHDRDIEFESASHDFRFAAAVALFGMILRDSPIRETSTYADVLRIATSAKGRDRFQYREEFVRLAARAEAATH